MLSLAWSSATRPPAWVRIGVCPICRTSVLVDDEFVRVGGAPRHRECDRYVRERSAGVRLSGGPGAASEAREELAAWGASLPPSTRAQAELLLTELVTNAVRHGGAHTGETVGVGFERTRSRLRITTTDPGPGFHWEPPPENRPAREGGYGLVLVEELARRWGIERQPGGTRVWFELHVIDAEPARSRRQERV